MNDDKPESVWEKSWKGPRAFLIWISVVAIASLFVALTTAVFGAESLDAQHGYGHFVHFFLLVMAGLFIASAVLFAFYKITRWLCCWKHFRQFLFGIACLATLIALFYAEEDWRGKHDWEKFKHQWEAKGEHFDFASIAPPTVPDSQNFAMAPVWVESMKAILGPTNSLQWFGSFAENGRTNFTDRLALEIYHQDFWYSSSRQIPPPVGNWQMGEIIDLKAWQKYYRTPFEMNLQNGRTATTNDFPVALQPQTPAQDILLALSKYDPAIEELREASQRPYSRFPVYANPDRPFETLLPHLADAKRCSQVLQLRAIAELQNGQSDAALADVKLMLYMVNSIRTEPFLISHLVRIAMFELALQPVYEGLAEHKWSDAQLAGLESELAKLDFLADYESSMRGERACSVTTIEYIRRNIRDFIETIGDFGIGDHHAAEQAMIFGYSLIPAGWFHQTELHISRFYQNWYLPVVNLTERTVSPSALRATDDALALEVRNRYPGSFLERMLLPALSAAVKKYAYAQESADLARVAIVLERYRLARGEYPQSLDSLAPQFISNIPHDIINAEPLQYRLSTTGRFTLYSVGWNETDDGGAVGYTKKTSPGDESPSRVDISQGDWVWQYPRK